MEGGQTYRSRQKHKSLSLQDLSIVRHWLGISFITSLESNLGTSLDTNNTTVNNCIISNAQITTECFKWNIWVTGHNTRDGRLSPAQRTAKVNCRFLSHYQYITALFAQQYFNCQALGSSTILSCYRSKFFLEYKPAHSFNPAE